MPAAGGGDGALIDVLLRVGQVHLGDGLVRGDLRAADAVGVAVQGELALLLRLLQGHLGVGDVLLRVGHGFAVVVQQALDLGVLVLVDLARRVKGGLGVVGLDLGGLVLGVGGVIGLLELFPILLRGAFQGMFRFAHREVEVVRDFFGGGVGVLGLGVLGVDLQRQFELAAVVILQGVCLLYTSPSPRDCS